MTSWAWRCVLCNVAGFGSSIFEASDASRAHLDAQHFYQLLERST